MKFSTLSFIGDISLNDKYRDLYKKSLKPFSIMENALDSSNFLIGNLECFAESDEGENLLKRPRLKTDIKTLNYLTQINLNLALLANNHVYDNLLEGFITTIDFLNKKGIHYIGAGLNKKKAEEPFFLEIENQKICILNYVTKDTNPNLPPNCQIYLNWFDESRAISEIKKYSLSSDKIILCLHWGGRCEGGYYPDWNQPRIARKLIDNGADIIVGHHSHTLQPYEIYKGKPIFYSLGNFCFSDISFEGKIIEMEKFKRTESIVLNLFFSMINLSFSMFPIENSRLFIRKDSKILSKLYLRNKIFWFLSRSKILWKLYFVKHKFFDAAKFFLMGNNNRPLRQIRKINFKKLTNFTKALIN